MKLLIMILKDESLLEQIASIMVEQGLYEAAIIDGENIESLAGGSVPLLTSFRSLFGDFGSYNRSIICPLGAGDTLLSLLAVFSQEGIDFTRPETGTLLTVPCMIYDGSNGGAL